MSNQAKGAIAVLAILVAAWAGLSLVADDTSSASAAPVIEGTVKSFERAGDDMFEYIVSSSSSTQAECTVVVNFLDADGAIVLGDAVPEQTIPQGKTAKPYRTTFTNEAAEVLDDAALARIATSTVEYRSCTKS